MYATNCWYSGFILDLGVFLAVTCVLCMQTYAMHLRLRSTSRVD